MSMKASFAFLIWVMFSLLGTGCKTDTFWDTHRYFETDKIEYSIGDTMHLTINIEIDEEKVIRVYENLQNIEISFALVNSELNVLNEEWSIDSGETLPMSKIENIKIAPKAPFVRTVLGVIRSQNDSILLEFPELNLDVKYSKKRLRRDSLRIHGFCRPINPDLSDSLEDYFDPKDIKINVNQ